MKDTVFTMRSTPYKFGAGVTEEIGDDLAALGLKRVLLVTSYDGFSVGTDLGNQVSLQYHDSNPFHGAITRVRINVDTTPFTPFETHRFIDGLGIKI